MEWDTNTAARLRPGPVTNQLLPIPTFFSKLLSKLYYKSKQSFLSLVGGAGSSMDGQRTTVTGTGAGVVQWCCRLDILTLHSYSPVLPTGKL